MRKTHLEMQTARRRRNLAFLLTCQDPAALTCRCWVTARRLGRGRRGGARGAGPAPGEGSHVAAPAGCRRADGRGHACDPGGTAALATSLAYGILPVKMGNSGRPVSHPPPRAPQPPPLTPDLPCSRLLPEWLF